MASSERSVRKSASESSSGEERVRAANAPRPRDISRLLHIRVPVIAVLGRKTMKLRQLLELTSGSVLPLDLPVDAPLELMVNNRRIGSAEVVRVGDQFGLRIVSLEPVDDTIRKLGGEETSVSEQGDR